MRRAGLVVVLAIAALAACQSAESSSDRCLRVQSQLDSCTGSSFGHLDCSAVTDKDLDNLDALSTGLACQALAGEAPLDGDPNSVTCRLLGIGCIAPVTPAPTHSPARLPILLVNGIDTSPLFRYSDRIVSTMREAGGHQVFLATLTAYEAPHERAPELYQHIKDVIAQTGASKVNLVCHSLGGLDCRYVVSPGGLAADLGLAPDAIGSLVASITTIGTAHRGTRVADVLLGLLPDGDSGNVVNEFATLVGDWFNQTALDGDVHLRDSIRALSIAEAPAFNAEIVDAPGVHYQSWAGYSRPFGNATAAHDAMLADLCKSDVAGEDGLAGFTKHDWMALTLIPFTAVAGRQDTDTQDPIPNDGFVTVASAKWGTFRGCIPADHMEQLGQKNLPDVNVRNGFDVARFYTNVAGDLAGQGF